jgi:hypothetical protein
MRKITQYIVDTFIADIDGEDYEDGFTSSYNVSGKLEPHVVEIIDDAAVVVRGLKGMYVVTNIGTADEFIMKLIERIEVRKYDEDGDDETEIVEWDSEVRYCASSR